MRTINLTVHLRTIIVRLCYKEILFEEEGILEPIGVDEEKVIRFTPQELGQHEFSCGMKMQKGSYTVVEKTRKPLSLIQRFWITSIFTVPLVILSLIHI